MAVRSAAQFVACWGGCTLIVWWLLAIIAGNRSSWALSRCKDANSSEADPFRSASRQATRVSWPLRILAVLTLAIWIPILPFTQREQQLRWSVETAFRHGRYHDGLLEMSAHELDDFPPQWEPPPRFLKGDYSAMLLDIWEEILRNDPAPWVRQHYLERFKAYVERASIRSNEEKVASVLNQMPEGEALLREWAAEPNMRWQLERLDSHLRPELRAPNLKAN